MGHRGCVPPDGRFDATPHGRSAGASPGPGESFAEPVTEANGLHRYEEDQPMAKDIWCAFGPPRTGEGRSEEHTSELQSRSDLVCRLLLEKKKQNQPQKDLGDESALGWQPRTARSSPHHTGRVATLESPRGAGGLRQSPPRLATGSAFQ